MTEEEKKNSRFGFIETDICVKESQCVKCLHNKGKHCDVFGEKPTQYVRAMIHEPCPKLKENNTITSFALEWYNCSNHSIEDISYEKTVFCRTNGNLTYESFNRNNEFIEHKSAVLSKYNIDKFFGFLDENRHVFSFESVPLEPVLDGSEWKMSLEYSTGAIMVLQGAIFYPRCGKNIEDQLRCLLSSEIKLKNRPHLFGCFHAHDNDV